jgi:hypothetical protein
MSKKESQPQLRLVPPNQRLQPARAEYLIVARRHQDGSYSFVARAVLLRPFIIQTWQLGTSPAGTAHAGNPWSALMHAAGLFGVDQEVIEALHS